MNIKLKTGSSEIQDAINILGRKGIPFVFVISYDLNRGLVQPVPELTDHSILFDINGYKNFSPNSNPTCSVNLKIDPVNFESYQKAFQKVMNHLLAGNSYLLNLTFRTHVDVNLSLDEIFLGSHAKYKLLTPGFVVFSPETFVQVRGNRIYSFPSFFGVLE